MAKKATKQATKPDRAGMKSKSVPSRADKNDRVLTETTTAGQSRTAEPIVKTAAKSSTDKLGAKKVLPVLSTADIGDHLASTFDMPKSHAKIYLNEAIALIGKHLKRGARVRLTGLGTLQVKKRAARKGRNPNTGEPIKIKASKRVVFAASSDLKAKL